LPSEAEAFLNTEVQISGRKINILLVQKHQNHTIFSFITYKLNIKTISVAKLQTLKIYRGMEIKPHTFLTLALDGGEQSVSCSGCFNLIVKAAGMHWIETCADSTANPDVMARENP
jgi:hypothetical protein